MSLRPIRKLLVANRGEIARRIFRSCRDLGIETVAVFSDADAQMPFVREADVAVRIGPPPSAESYLDIAKVLDAAARAGADAVHPGYGFLAENADFADAVEKAGLLFVGPPSAAIRAMGSKREAKALASAAGVPVVPGYDGSRQDPTTLAREAEALGFPVLLKASAGGGGKGMRRVNAPGELPTAIESAKREALGAFGDDTLLIERYVERPRHVEVQIVGDTHGRLIHLYERECSIQRRHQKILEESPSPALDDELRHRMGEAAVKVGQAIGYHSAGTVEFILAPDGSFYFLEVNTRLQVEHPVTEGVTGLDLVRMQLSIAEGRPLELAQEDVPFRGAALEARIYAEDPQAGFLPQSGHVTDWHLPDLPGVRVDAGVEAGSEIGIHYDPMLAKIITTGTDRSDALRRMRHALRSLSVQGITTNRAFLLRVLDHEAYRAGEIHTHFIERHAAELLEAPLDRRASVLAALAATLFDHARRAATDPVLPTIPSGFRNNPRARQWVRYEGERDLHVEYLRRPREPHGFDAWIDDATYALRLLSLDGANLSFEVDGMRQRARVVARGDRRFVHVGGQSVALRVVPRFPERSVEIPAGACIAPMPGTIVEVRVAVGERVEAGRVLLVMEAMKMEHTVTAPHGGTVAELRVGPGDQVDADALLAVVEAAP